MAYTYIVRPPKITPLHVYLCAYVGMSLQCEAWKECGDLETLDEAWEEIPDSPSGEIRDFPFQQTLFRFLDTHAPLPGQRWLLCVHVYLRNVQ